MAKISSKQAALDYAMQDVIKTMMKDGIMFFMEYTLEQFAKDFKALLNKAIEAGHSVDEIGEMADAILEGPWDVDAD